MDNTYQVVKTLRLAGTAAALFDMHEFHLIDDGKRALFTAYQAQPYDLSPFGMSENIGWIHNSLFQEISVETGELLFEWRSLDHEETSPKYGQVLPGETLAGGKGTTASDAWDYFHINSVDKNENGDYLISSRHTSALYLISGKDGRVLWQLDGWLLSSHFQKDFYFSSQHDARWQHSNTTHTTISLFDNAYDEFKPHDNQTHPYSRGLIFVIDNEAKTATFSHEYKHHAPNGPPILSGSQGNFQLLPNGNAFLGWGAQPFFSEHLASGAPVLHASFIDPTRSTTNYKARKYNWTAVPAHDPALWSYSYDGSTATSFYVSWNGATTVRTWRVCVSDSGVGGPWRRVGEAQKGGFETVLRWDGFARWAFAEAVDGEGRVLRRSGVVEVFVPSEGLRRACGFDGCVEIPRVGAGEWSAFEVSGSGTQEEVFGSDYAFDGKSHYLPEPAQDSFGGSSRMLMLGLFLSTGVCIAGLGVWLYLRLRSKLQIKYTKLHVELSDVSSSR